MRAHKTLRNAEQDGSYFFFTFNGERHCLPAPFKCLDWDDATAILARQWFIQHARENGFAIEWEA